MHRALVTQKDDYTGQPTFKLLSQSDVINFLCANMDHPALAPILGKPYGSLIVCLELRKHLLFYNREQVGRA